MTAKRKSAGSNTKQKRPAAARKPRVAPLTDAARTGSGLAPGMQAINAHLAVANVGASLEFLERAFGFTRGVTLADPDGQLRYAEVRHGDSVVMLIRKGDEATASGGATALYTYVNDVDRALTRAREAGAGVGEAEDKAWGDRAGVVTDPDGYRWVLATFKKLAPFGGQ